VEISAAKRLPFSIPLGTSLPFSHFVTQKEARIDPASKCHGSRDEITTGQHRYRYITLCRRVPALMPISKRLEVRDAGATELSQPSPNALDMVYRMNWVMTLITQTNPAIFFSRGLLSAKDNSRKVSIAPRSSIIKARRFFLRTLCPLWIAHD
jgi:hypothetical protein